MWVPDRCPVLAGGLLLFHHRGETHLGRGQRLRAAGACPPVGRVPPRAIDTAPQTGVLSRRQTRAQVDRARNPDELADAEVADGHLLQREVGIRRCVACGLPARLGQNAVELLPEAAAGQRLIRRALGVGRLRSEVPGQRAGGVISARTRSPSRREPTGPCRTLAHRPRRPAFGVDHVAISVPADTAAASRLTAPLPREWPGAVGLSLAGPAVRGRGPMRGCALLRPGRSATTRPRPALPPQK